MADPLDDQAQTRLAVAALFAALAQTLREQDESFPSRFEENVDRIYHQMKNYESVPIQAMEALRWTNELVRENS